MLYNHTCLKPDDFSHGLPLGFTRGNDMKLAKPRVLCDRHGIFSRFVLLILGILCLITLCLRSSLSVIGFKAGVSKLHFCGHCSVNLV